jgi:hypothetical protein
LLPAKIYKDDGAHTVLGTITDISKGGCKFIVENEALVAHFTNTQTMHISYPDPARGMDAVRFVRVCSKRKHGKKSVALGLSFIEALAQSA